MCAFLTGTPTLVVVVLAAGAAALVVTVVVAGHLAADSPSEYVPERTASEES